MQGVKRAIASKMRRVCNSAHLRTDFGLFMWKTLTRKERFYFKGLDL